MPSEIEQDPAGLQAFQSAGPRTLFRALVQARLAPMTRISKRAFAGILVLAFLLGGVGDALGAHHCPHHDGTPAGARTAEPAAHAHDPGAHPDSHGPCTCVGRCHAGAAPSLPVLVMDRDLPVPAPPPLSFPAPQPLVRLAIVPFSLPWGNAPPSL
jgi:hypothetical protein